MKKSILLDKYKQVTINGAFISAMQIAEWHIS